MATPTRTSLLAAIDTALSAISIANGYKTDVTTVSPFLRSRDDVTSGERPFLGFGFDVETYEPQNYQNMRVTVRWFVTGCANVGPTWSAASATLNNLVDDIIAGVMSDDTFGGNAVQTRLIGTDTDESDADILQAGYGWVFAEFETIYNRKTTAS